MWFCREQLGRYVAKCLQHESTPSHVLPGHVQRYSVSVTILVDALVTLTTPPKRRFVYDYQLLFLLCKMIHLSQRHAKVRHRASLRNGSMIIGERLRMISSRNQHHGTCASMWQIRCCSNNAGTASYAWTPNYVCELTRAHYLSN